MRMRNFDASYVCLLIYRLGRQIPRLDTMRTQYQLVSIALKLGVQECFQLDIQLSCVLVWEMFRAGGFDQCQVSATGFQLFLLFSRSVVYDSETPWTAARQASLSFTIFQSLLKLMSIESMIPSNHLILCHPLLLLPSIFPSIRVFSNELALCIRWPKYWSFSFSICPSNEYSGLISFRISF